MSINYLLQLLALGLLLFVSACRPSPATPFEALTEWPGKLDGADSTVLESVQILKEEEAAGGLVILYSIPSDEPGENVLVSTFVTPEGSGWRAQSSGWKGYSSSDDFVVSGIAGGNITNLTTVSGISNKGETVRIEWSDGRIDFLPIESGVFLFSRPETLTYRRIELLDSDGEVMESAE